MALDPGLVFVRAVWPASTGATGLATVCVCVQMCLNQPHQSNIALQHTVVGGVCGQSEVSLVPHAEKVQCVCGVLCDLSGLKGGSCVPGLCRCSCLLFCDFMFDNLCSDKLSYATGPAVHPAGQNYSCWSANII
jgi:hypothetical protein